MTCAVLLPEIPPVQSYGKEEQRNVNGREVMREPAWQVDVCDGSAWVTEPSRQCGQGAMEAIAHEDERFPSYNCSSSGSSPVGLPAETRIEQIDHAGLDTEPSQSMKGFDCPKGHLFSSHAVKKNTAGGR